VARPDRLVAPALGALWTNRARLRFAWDVLKHGVCNDCSLGSAGLRDGVLAGSHLCDRRLRRLPRVTADAVDPARLTDVSTLRALDEAQLHRLGRLSAPAVWRTGTAGFEPLSWTDATHLLEARLRDSRAESAWSLLVNPADVDLETLFVLARTARALERRTRDRDGLPAQVDLIVPDAERQLRHRAQAVLGTWGSTASLDQLDTGDPVAVIEIGNHPLLGETIEALRRRGVLVLQEEAHASWPVDVRHTLVYGHPGVLGALEVGLTLAAEAPTAESLARLSAAWIVGEVRSSPVPGCPFRAHQAAFLEPAMLEPAAEAVLLLPTELPSEQAGGATFAADDGTVRFSPQVLGHGIPGTAAGWEIAVRVLAHAELELADGLAAHHSLEIRAAMASTLPRLAGVALLGAGAAQTVLSRGPR
jgi:hypothetical protein